MHRNSAGFMEIPLIGYAALAAALVMGLTGLWAYVEKQRYEALKQEYEQFKGGVEALGQAAKKKADQDAAADKARQEKTDADHKRIHDADAATIARLRARHPSSSFVPPAPAASSRPELACFDRADYSRADGVFTEGARRLADEGAAATLDLNSAKAWAQRPFP